MSRLRVLAVFAALCVTLSLSAADVFISEYVEGSSNNKAIELYNPTASAIDLTADSYKLEYYFNGNPTVGTTITLNGTIPAGGTFVVTSSLASAAVVAYANQTNGSSWFNGDDAILLKKGAVVIDSIGQVGTDPGSEWGTGVQSTADNTIRRKAAVCVGDTTSNDAFDPATEWDGFAGDTFTGLGTHTASCGGGSVLTIGDVSLAEGDAGTTTFTFTVSLSSAPAGSVTFDIATADGTASAGSDYVANSLTGQTITGPATTATFSVTVNGDTTTEADETFFVNVTNVVGATVGDGQGLGTIQNDDITLTPIHDVQGPGATSPLVGATVTVRGIVTGVKSNGFFVQENDATTDADPNTSEGIFVFTSSAPPAAAEFTALVQVTGTVAEFTPSSDPFQPPVTELTSPTVVQIASAQPLPTPVVLTSTFPDPAGAYDQLEIVEGMRVSAASITVSGPTDGNVSEANNTGTTNGRFHGVVTGVARPFREPGIQQPDLPPVGSIPPIPRWDTNPERLRIESGTINAQPLLTVKTGDVVGPVVGPLDYGYRGYAIYPDGTVGTPAVTAGTLTTTVTTAAGNEFTIASFNMQRFYDTTNDGATSDVVLTATAFADRLTKASLAIRNHLRFPDIIGVQEMENLSTLQTLATKISDDAVAAGQPDPMYVAYLSEGNDIGGIDVGYLVKTAPVLGGAPRVTVNSVAQIGAGDTWIDPDDGGTALLNDRPSLVLDAVVNRASGASFPVVVINNHLRSLIGIESEAADGATTQGDRVRRKRQTQADRLAAYLQTRLTTQPGEHIVLVGDFNAFDFNDGYVDVINTITGTPPPDNETVVCATCGTAPDTNDGVDQVDPDFTNLVNTPVATERYSYIHDGNAQNIDHAIISAGLMADTVTQRIEHPRINADYPETLRSDNTSALRISDHDPVVAYFAAATLAMADISVAKSDSPDPVIAGQNVTYTITVTNAGPDAADTVSWSDTLPAGTTFVSLSSPGGWSCSTPAVGGTGTVTCSAAALGVSSAAFDLVVNVSAALIDGSILENSATASSSTADPNSGNETATASTTVAANADLVVASTGSPDPVAAGANVTYSVTVANAGPSVAWNVTFDDTLPAGTSFVSLAAPAGWSCTTPAVGATGSISCTSASLAVTSAAFTLTVTADPSLAGGTVLTNTATALSMTSDANGANNISIETTTVTTSADVSITKIDTPDPVTAGTTITYTLTVANVGPGDATNATLSDTLPANTTFVSLSAPGGWSCTTPAVGGTGTIDCSVATLAAGVNAGFTLTVSVDPSLTDGSVISNTATASSTTSDPNFANNAATATTTVASGSADLSITKTDTPDPVTAGSNLTWSITLSNAGPSAASNVTLSDTLPTGTTFVSFVAPAGWSCTTPAVGGTGSVSCSNAGLGITSAGFTLTVAVDPTLIAGNVITNTVTTSSATEDPNGANNTASATSTVVTSADVSITKVDTPDPVTAGTNLTYTISIANAGPSAAADAAMNDTLPADTTFVSLTAPAGWSCTTPAVGGSGTVDCSIASLAPGTNADFVLVVAVDPSLIDGSIVTNTATAATTTTDPNAANNSATATTTIGLGSADLSITKVDTPDPVTAGTNLTYTISIANAGPSTAADAAMNDTLPADTTFVSLTAPAGWSCTTPAVGGSGTVDCSIASLVPGTNADFVLVVAVDPSLIDGSIVTNTATAATTTTDPNAANNSATATTTIGLGSADLSIGKIVSPDPVNAGGTLTYTITVANAGPTNASTVVLSDALPAATTFVSFAAPAAWSCTTPAVGGIGTITCTNDGLAIGSDDFTLIVAVDGDAAPGTVISNTATVSSSTADPSTGNESATATASVLAPAALSATKSVGGTFLPGGSITYTIVITNNGVSTQADNPGDELVDVLPSSLIPGSVTATSGTAAVDAATNTVTWNGTIGAGETVTITVNATIESNVAAGTVVSNQATIHFDADGNGTNEATGQTDDPSAAGSTDATSFAVAAASIAAVPTLDELALLALAMMLAMVAVAVLKK